MGFTVGGGVFLSTKKQQGLESSMEASDSSGGEGVFLEGVPSYSTNTR